MRWVRDRSRRFERRPFYDQHELDDQCEELVAGFLNGKNGSVEYPISTDDLTVMIERECRGARPVLQPRERRAQCRGR